MHAGQRSVMKPPQLYLRCDEAEAPNLRGEISQKTTLLVSLETRSGHLGVVFGLDEMPL